MLNKKRRGNGVELMEDRRLMSVSLNSQGWTVVTHDSSAHVIYVSSSSGRDSNSGSASSPIASLAKGYSLLRNGSDDQLLLKRGDTFSNTFPIFKIAGESSQLPILIGTYGSGSRPVVNCGTGNGIIANTVHSVSNLIIDGIAFTDNGRDPTKTGVSGSAAAAQPTGLELLGPSSYVTIEDCNFTDFKDNVVLESGLGSVNHITIRRSEDSDSYCTSTRSQGFYASNVSAVTIDQDVFDHNGWNSSISGAGITGYNHDIYYSETCSGMIVTNNIIADASSDGVLARSGGTIDGNLFLNDAVGVSFGNANGANSTSGGVVGQINNNVFMGDHAIGSTRVGEGIEIGNVRANSGVTISGNIFTGDNELAQPAISLVFAISTHNPSVCVGINDLTVSNNIIDGWRDGILIAGFTDGGRGLSGLNDLKVTNNQFQNTPAFLVNHENKYSSSQEHWSGNVYYTSSNSKPIQLQGNDITTAAWKSIDPTGPDQKENYPAATRNAGTYNAGMGGSNSLTNFMSRVDVQSISTWNFNLTASSTLKYLQAGFGIGAGPASPGLTKLTGTVIGTSGSFRNSGDTTARAIDGNINTFFDGPTGSGDWVGLDLGTGKNVKQISFAPRAQWADRMVGGEFHASNSSNFSSGVMTFYTVKTTPPEGKLTTVSVSVTGNYRYYRFLSPNGAFGDVSEINFYG